MWKDVDTFGYIWIHLDTFGHIFSLKLIICISVIYFVILEVSTSEKIWNKFGIGYENVCKINGPFIYIDI